MMDEVRWGLIGAGDIVAKRVAAALSDAPHSRLVAVSRRQPALLEEFARRYGARAHADWRALVEDAEVDAVYIATPVALHAPMAIAAARAGKHVLCEKPMALSVEECDRMIDAARGAGVALGVAYYRRFYPIVRRMCELLSEGAIGRPVIAHLDAFERFDPGVTHPRRWLVDPAQSGGGPMMDFGCHRIELLLHLFGDVAEVGGVLAKTLFDRAVEDTAVATLRFATGPVGVVTVTHAAAEPRDSFHLYGSEGSIHVERLNGATLRLRRDEVETVEEHPLPANTHLPLVQEFVEAVRGGVAPAVDDTAGRAVNEVLARVYREGIRSTPAP